MPPIVGLFAFQSIADGGADKQIFRLLVVVAFFSYQEFQCDRRITSVRKPQCAAQWTVPAVRGRTDFIPLPCHCVGILSSMAITASTALAVESRPLSDGPLDQLRSKSQNAATLSSREPRTAN